MSKAERSEPKDFAVPFRLTLEGAKARRGYTSLRDAVLYIPIGDLFRSLPYDFRTREATEEENAKATRPQKRRTLDYLLPRPFSALWHYRIVPPPGFQAAALPPSAARALGVAQFSEEYSLDKDGTVRAEFRFDTHQRRFTADEQRKVREEIATLLDRESIAVKFDLQAHALFTQGQGRQSFQAYRDLVARHPKDPIQHLRRADALIDAGMGDAARAEVATAIKLDPKLALAHARQALILQYDAIGRWHFEGADYAGAAAAYRAATSLDHDDHALVANYAILLEHDKNGLRYAPGADLKGAIAAYRQLTSEQREELKVPQNLAYALFYDRQYAAALEAANALDSPPLALLVAGDAQLNGAAHALAEARRRSASSDAYKQSAAVAGNMLMNLREYQNAAALLEAGASGASTAPMMTLVNMLRNARKHEDLPKEDGPLGAMREAFAAVMANGAASMEPDAFQSRNARAEWARLPADRRDSEKAAARGMLSGMQRSGLPADVLTDIVLQAMQIKATGDDATGYRITMQATGMPTQTAFMVKEDGKYLQLAFKPWPAPIATEVIERVQKGDLAGGATLLAWLREASPSGEGADDPYSAVPLTRFWALGQRQGDEAALRLAAASIWVMFPSTAERGVALLEQAKRGATGAQAEAIDIALLWGYEQLRDHARALACAEALARRAPQSLRAFHSQVIQLRALDRFTEADALAEQRLKSLPDDIDALRALTMNAAAAHDYSAAYSRGMKVLADPRSTASDENQVAWHSLFFAREGGPDVDNAMRASQGRENNTASALHTLGCMYAEIGKTIEARSVLLQAMAMRNLTEPNGDYWYAFGRIAEQYGEREVALADYAKVKPPEDTSLAFTSSYELAQRRLKALGVK
jgi:tetratricopeptide (TPR) repeat protein